MWPGWNVATAGAGLPAFRFGSGHARANASTSAKCRQSTNRDAENLPWHPGCASTAKPVCTPALRHRPGWGLASAAVIAAGAQESLLASLAVWSPWSAHRRRRRREGRIGVAMPRVAAGRLHALFAIHECAARRAGLCVHPAPGIILRDCGLRPGCYRRHKYQRTEEAFVHGKSSSLDQPDVCSPAGASRQPGPDFPRFYCASITFHFL
jgi:hypothetical protein